MNTPAPRSRKIRAISIAIATLAAASAHAGGPAQITKDNNTTVMNDTSSWVGGVIPGSSEIAVFDSTINPITGSIQFGADTSWGGIKVLGPVQGGTNTTTNTVVLGNTTGTSVNLTIGSGGIDMSAATTPLALGAAIFIGSNQTWNVTTANLGITSPAAPTLPTNTLNPAGNALNPFGLNAPLGLLFSGVGAPTGVANQIPFDLGGFTVDTTGNGSIMLHSGFNVTNGTINVGNGAGAPVVYNGFANFGETFIIQSGGTHNASVASDVTFNVATSLRFQSNSGSMISSATINLGSDAFGTPVDGAILGLVTANTGTGNQTTLAGPLNVLGNSIITVSNQPQTGTGGASNAPTTISGNISGFGNLTVQVSANATNNVLQLSGDNSGYTGAFNLTTGNPSNPGSRTVRFLTDTSGSASASWNVDTDNTFQIGTATPTPTPASIELGTLTGNGNITGMAAGSAVTVNSGTFGGVLGANLSLTKGGATNSVLILSGDSPLYTGNTTVSSGVLAVSGNIGGSTVLVSSLGQLVGSGAVGTVTTQPGGIINPITNLTAANLIWDGTIDASASIIMGLGNMDSSSDMITITGNFTKGITGTSFMFDFDNTGNPAGAIYTLITFGGTTDFTVGDLSYTGLASGLTGIFGFSANSLTFTVSVVPEPAEWAALFGAMALLAAVRRRRTRA